MRRFRPAPAGLAADDTLLRDGHLATFPVRPALDSLRVGGMASDGDLLRAVLEAGRAAAYRIFSELAGKAAVPEHQQPIAGTGHETAASATAPERRSHAS